jgi:RNA polymerase sigma-70 factor (ECF subfamily)
VIYKKLKHKMKGENEEFEKELMNAYNMLARHAMFLTNNMDVAEDLLQETLLRILTNSDKYKDDGKFNSWAKTVMKNIFLNERQNHEKYRTRFIDGYDYINNDEVHPLVSENDNYIYSKSDIYKAISMLPAKYAQIITMQMSGYKYEEIAKSFNLSTGCLKSTLFLAKCRLKKILSS